MQLHLSHLRGKHKDLYSFPAVAQHTKFAVTPVHTEKEYKLFMQQYLLEDSGVFHMENLILMPWLSGGHHKYEYVYTQYIK